MLIRTPLTAQICFLLMMLISQWLILTGINAVFMLTMLIGVKALMIGIDLYYAKRKHG
jgi:hypothetical protein